MTAKEIQIIKYIALQIKLAMKDRSISFRDLAEKAKISPSQLTSMLDSVKGLTYQYTFRTLMKICIELNILNIQFDENEIVNLTLKYQKDEQSR